jgi:GTP-binding protein HflX
LLTFNKADLVEKDVTAAVCKRFNAVSISAKDQKSCRGLIKAIEGKLWPLK